MRGVVQRCHSGAYLVQDRWSGWEARLLCSAAALMPQIHPAMSGDVCPAPSPSYYESKSLFDHLRVPMFPPGRLMLLRRLKPARHQGSAGAHELQPAAPPPQGRGEQHAGGASTAGRGQLGRQGQGQRGRHWDAVRVAPEALMSEGILLSR